MDAKISSLYSYIRQKPKRALTAGLLLYSAMFTLIFSVSFLTILLDTGSLMVGDGVSQFYPYTLEFRRMLISFFDSFGSGSPSIPMISMNFSFGSDNFTSVLPDYLPFLPYYIFLPLIPESAVHTFWSIGTVIMLFIAGLSFFFMCRYFGKDPLISGFFAAFFSFCGNTVFLALPNQHMIYILMSMPLLIAGIDKIIRKKGFVLFTLTLCWLSLDGFVHIVYTLPFVILFAVIRVYFVYPNNYFRNLGVCFLRGAGACLLGLAMGAVILLPCLSDYMSGARVSEQISLDIAPMLIPKLDHIKDMLVPSPGSSSIVCGIAAAGIPFVIWSITKVSGSKELKWYTAVMILIVSLPIVRYAMNAFRYDICRWGMIPGLLMCFICVCSAEDIIHELSAGNCKKQIIFTSAVSLIYLALLAVELSDAAVILLCTVLLFTMMPFAGKVLDKAGDLTARIINALKKPTPASKAAALGIIVIGGTGLILYFAYALSCKFNFAALVIAVIVFAAACTAALFFGKARHVIALIGAVGLIVSVPLNYISLINNMIKYAIVTEMPDTVKDTLKSVSSPENGGGSFGRLAYFGTDNELMTSPDDPDLNLGFAGVTDPEENDDTEKYDSNFDFGDLALRYDLYDSSVFKSVINGDYFRFHERLGEGQDSLCGMNFIPGFGSKEPLLSLLGISAIYDFYAIDNVYGTEMICSGAERPDGLYLYRYKYALPAGSTYSCITGKARFDSFRSDDFPFAAMNEVYLEGEPMPVNMQDGGISYAKICDITHESSLRGTTSYGIDCYDNTVHIKDDVSDCFLYITFNGVFEETNPSSQFERFHVNIDDKLTAAAKIHNRISNWPWNYISDTYTISLGYHAEDVDKLDFTTPFDYTGFYVSAVPASVFTSAYENVSAEKLENIALSANTLTGTVTVSEDKALVINMLDLKGWRAYVDGSPTPVYKANGLFIGIPLTAGSHDIRLEYVTAYLPEGALITGGAVLLLIIICIIAKRNKKRTDGNTGNGSAEASDNIPGRTTDDKNN